MPNDINPLYTRFISAIFLLFLQVATDHQGCSHAFTHRASHLLVLPPRASPAANTFSMLVSMVPLVVMKPHLSVSTISLTKAVLESRPMNINAADGNSSSFSPGFRS